MNQARKRTGTKKVLSMILVLVMLLSLLSMAAFTLPASETGNSKNSYDYNIMFLDCGRKYFSVDSIKQIIDNASAAGFNYIQLAVGNDGLRFLLDDMSLTVNGTTYDSETVKSAIHAGNEAYYNFDVDELTQSEMDTIIAYAGSKGMGVIPCVNTPGHMDAILSAATSLTGTNCSYNGSVRTIDVTNATAVAFTQALLQKYITYFAGKGCQLFNMGADEYANDKYDSGSMGFGNLQSSGNYRYYVNYVNDVAKMIKAAKMTPMAFNDGIYFNNNTSSGTFDTDIIVCYWSNGWSSYSPMPASKLDSMGFKLINTNGSYYWVLGKTDAQCDAAKAGGFDKTAFPGGTVSNPVGSMFCIWADYPGAETEASVISKTAATIAAFGKTLPQVGIKSSGGTALTLNGSTELTVPGNAEATWSVEPAGVIELQVSGNADERSAITGTSVIAKAVGAGTAKVTATVDDKTAYTTTLTVTDPSTVDVTVAVNGTKTITVDGYYNGSYATEDTTIATASAVGTAAVDRTENEVTTIESGKQYLIVHKKSGLVLNDSTSGNGILLGDKNSNTDQLWTIKKSESGTNEYTLLGADGKYITEIASGTATLGTSGANVLMKYSSSGYWDIYQVKKSTDWLGYTTYTSYYLNQYGGPSSTKAAGYSKNGASDEGSQWKIYKVTPETKEQTTITFTGKSVGDTSVQIGDVTYMIHVTKELPANVLTADTITLEHWITNGRVAQQSGTSGDDINVQTISNTSNNVQTDDGVALDTLSFNPGYWNKDTPVYFWKGARLDSVHKQQAIDGCDMTTQGTDITHVRYLDGAWQYKTMGGEWHYFLTTDQFVIYYLQKTEVTAEVDTYVKDWGYGTNGTTPDTSSQKGQVALTVAVVYPDGTVSPVESGMYAKSTTIFNYWENRDIGIIAPKNNSDYNISKITVTDGTRDKNTSDLVWYKSDTITWDKKTTAAGGKWYNEQEVWNKSSSTTPMVNGKASNITWSDKNTAKLVLIYLEPVVKETNLNIVYWDDTANKQINPNTIQISMAYNQGGTVPTYFTALCDANGNVIGDKGPWNSNVVDSANYLPNDAYVVNSSNVHQTISKDMTQIEGIAGNYTSGLYEYRSADISTDGKTLTLHYGLKDTGTKTYVVDFGLPVTIPLSDLGITDLNTISWISLKQEDKECLTDHGTYGAATIDKNNWTVTYTLDQTLDNEIAIPINIKFSNSDQIFSYSFHVIPATSVYYEDSFATFTNGTGNASAATWTTDKDDTDPKATTTQALSALGSKDVYGHDAAYADSTKLSMGSARKVTVSKDMYVKGDTTTTWPTATFTFKGTGFDVISLTDNKSGAISVKVYAVNSDGTEKQVEGTLVNNYYGYEFKDGAWTVKPGANNALYQIPVIKIGGLDYGTYKVVITAAYATYADKTGDNQYSFWLDAIRVYDPMGKDNDTYKQDNEGYPQYIKLHDALVAENVENALFIDGAAAANITDYKNYGPNNEVYLANGQAITFTVPKNDKIASIQIGAKAPSGSAAQMVVNGEAKDIQSATEMYYEILKAGGSFTITNTGTGILSLTNLKITFKDKPDSTIALTAPTAEEQTAAVKSVRALFAAPEQTFEPEHFTAKWSRNVRKGGTATLTVKASADVEAITVNGEKITAHTTKTERSFWGSKETYHVFTYRETNAATADYSVCALNAGGVASDPIIATLTVRPSIRDWWNGIFDKWKH